jgi:DNA-binding transcriptional ArsR family regulator
MNDALHIPPVAALLSDPARAAMLWLLIDGTTRPAGELAFAAKVSPQSASAHLAKLVQGGLLENQASGRHRYFRIASAEAAALVERMASFGAATQPRTPPSPAIVREMPSQFQHARTCYDHLAGELAVRIMQAVLQARWLAGEGNEYEATPRGRRELAALGIDLEHVLHGRRPFARGCVDLTQRRPHLAGCLGAAMLDVYLREGWILRAPKSRVVSITARGTRAFRDRFGVDAG